MLEEERGASSMGEGPEPVLGAGGRAESGSPLGKAGGPLGVSELRDLGQV